MHDVPLLATIALALGYALVGGFAARRLGLPTIVGYLVAGVALGPFTPGLAGDADAIRQLAELGVILLMFSVGLHFSLRDLWAVRDIAIPGATIRMAAATAAGYWIAVGWGWERPSALVLGFAVSVASTVVLMRGLTDLGILETSHGRVAVGWAVMEDLATVALLVLLPAIVSPGRTSGWALPALAVVKALVFVVLMLFLGKRIIPMLLGAVALTGSRELFVLVALTAALGTALGAAATFGVSLALGAFVAGAVVSESPFSHQINADLLPFREAFAVLFFVSVGMLINPGYLAANWRQVAAISALIVGGKGLLGALIGFAFPYPARTALVVAAGLSQIGEFSFIVGQAGVTLGVLDRAQYSLILAGAVVSITVNPWMLQLIDPVECLLKRRPRLWAWLDRHGPEVAPVADLLAGHVVIVGCGRVGRHIVEVARQLAIPRLVVESDAGLTRRLQQLEIPVLFGDAANRELLRHARLERARALVVTVPNDVTALLIVTIAQSLAPSLPIIARASAWEAARRLKEAGARDVIRPELEGGVEIVRSALMELGFPTREVQRYTDAVRREGLEVLPFRDERTRALEDLARAVGNLDLGWLTIGPESSVTGRTIGACRVRTETGASIVAISRLHTVISNPGPMEILNAGDRLAVIGSPAEIARVERLLADASQTPAPGSGAASALD